LGINFLLQFFAAFDDVIQLALSYILEPTRKIGAVEGGSFGVDDCCCGESA